MTETRIRLGLLGCGTVGRGVARLIKENQQDIQRRVGAPVEIHRILVRDKTSDRGPDVDANRVTTRADAILDDPYIDIVVELMGGMDPTLAYVNSALQQNRHVGSSEPHSRDHIELLLLQLCVNPQTPCNC